MKGEEDANQWPIVSRSLFFPVCEQSKEIVVFESNGQTSCESAWWKKRKYIKIRFGAYLSKFESINVFGDEDNCLKCVSDMILSHFLMDLYLEKQT